MKTKRRPFDTTISRPMECPACHIPRPVEGGKFAAHFLASTIHIVWPNTLKGDPCPYSGKKAARTVSHESTREG